MAKPTNSIKKIKVGSTTYDVVPSMVTDGTYKASCPTLTADATLATTNDLTNNIKEAYLKWGGRNIAGSYAPIDACMNPVLSPNRIAGMNPAGITVEYTNDGGTTWTDYGLTDAQKKALVTTSQSITIGKTGNKTADSKVRVTLDGVNGSVYTALNKMHIYISTNYSNGCKVTMESYDYNSSTAWHTVISDQSISGWSGWNVLNFTLPGTGAFGGTNSNTHQRKIRLTFSHTSITAGHESAGLNISKIYAYGGVGWTTPSTLASNGVPYSYDYAGNITCMGTLRATSLNENGTNLASKYVRVDTASQGLTDTQKSNARTNIGAGTSNFTGYTSSNKLTTDYIQNDAGWTSNVGTVTSVNNTSPDANGNVTINIPTPDYPVTDVKIGNTSIVSSKVATIQTNSTYDATTNKIATMSDLPTVPTTYLKSASTNGNTLTLTPNSGSNVVFTPTFTEQHIGDVVSVGATSGSNIAIGGTTANPTVGVASGYSIPSTTKQGEWDAKYDKPSGGIPSTDLADTYVTTNTTQTITGAKTFSGNPLTLYSASGDSPMLIFQRGTLTDTYNDWAIVDSAGFLYFKQRGSGSTGWTDNRVIMSQSYTDIKGEIYENGTSLKNKYLAKSNTSGLVKNDGTIDTNTYYLASNPNGYTTNTGTVTSVRVQASDCITSSQSTAQSATLDTTIKHSELNTSGAQTTKSLYLIKIDKYGHITEAEATSLSEYTGEASGAVTYDIYNGSMSSV